MRLLILITLTILFESQTGSSLAPHKSMNLYLCMRNKTLSVQILANTGDENPSCQCQAGFPSDPYAREDYVHTPGVGSHKLHTDARTWNDARRICKEENSHLAIINSMAEEAVLLDLLQRKSQFIKNGSNKEQAYLGIHDFFKEGEWVTLNGESIYSTGYAKWSTEWYGVQPDNYNTQNCGALVIRGGMDDVNCDEKFAFFCELPLTCAV